MSDDGDASLTSLPPWAPRAAHGVGPVSPRVPVSTLEGLISSLAPAASGGHSSRVTRGVSSFLSSRTQDPAAAIGFSAVAGAITSSEAFGVSLAVSPG